MPQPRPALSSEPSSASRLLSVPPSGSVAARASHPARQMNDTAFAYMLHVPAIAFIIFLVIYPIFNSLWISLHQYNLKKPLVFNFVGLSNYVDALRTPLFWQSLGTTAVFTFSCVVLVLGIGTGIALVVNERFRGRGLLRGFLLLPWAIPPIVNGLMWQWIFNSKVGALNGLLYSLGVIDSYRSWLLDTGSAVAVLVFAQVWNDSPFAAIVILAGLQAIPPELYDAAQVDRADVLKRFRYITLPWLTSSFVIIMIVETLAAVRVFDLIYVMTGGGPGYATTVLSWLTYQTSFVNLDFGSGNAYAYIIAMLALALALLYMRALYSKNEIRQ